MRKAGAWHQSPAGGSRELHGRWQQGQAAWEEHRSTAQLCRDGGRKAKAGLELARAQRTRRALQGQQPAEEAHRKPGPSEEGGWQQGRRRLRCSVTLLP